MSLSSRPGPRTDLDVRAVLVATAERMFGSDGIGAVSLRAIGREAGVSSAGVLYHFPTKDLLVAAVMRSRGEDLGRQVRANFNALLEMEGAVTTRQVVDAILVPMVELINADPEPGLHWFKVLTQLAQANDEIWVEDVRQAPDLNVLFHDVTIRALPDIETEDVRRRLGIAMFSMFSSLASADLGGLGADPRFGPAGLDPRFVEQLARFTAAGIATD